MKDAKKKRFRFFLLFAMELDCGKGVQESMKQLAQPRVRWRVGVVDGICPGRDQGN